MAPIFRHRKLLIYRRLKNKLRIRNLGKKIQFYETIQYSPDELEQLSIADYIQTLDKNEKKQFHKENPELSELLFLNEEQKQEYFAKKNEEYFKKLQHEHHRHANTKKNVRFNDKFEVKYFNSEGSAEQVATQDIEEEQYHYGIHFSH